MPRHQPVIQEVFTLRATLGLTLRDQLVASLYSHSEAIARQVVNRQTDGTKDSWDDRLDRLVTSRWLGFPIMFLLLGLVFYLTIEGTNIPSAWLAQLLFGFQGVLTGWAQSWGMPPFLQGLLIDGVYKSSAWVVSVMLPPMAIFFPLFTLLEDLGYLPRIAFNLDRIFRTFGGHGKQALTMAMGFGCNAAGVTACRIIESPRERLIAILTNNFVPCNGRFPTLIAMTALLMGAGLTGQYNSLSAAALVTGLVLTGVAVTLIASWLLNKTLAPGIPSSFTLELPPYRLPKVGEVIVRSIFDRTLKVLRRALVTAAPAGALTWLLANIQVGNYSLLAHLAAFFDPLGRAVGLDGTILLAFLLGLPANEIVIPILLMTYLSSGSLSEMESLTDLWKLLSAQGWTGLTLINLMVFSLFHAPCATTLWTIKKEAGGRWMAFSLAANTALALALCYLIALTAHLFHLA